MKRYIGIDPGSSGAIAMIPEDGEIEVHPLDNDTLKICCQAWQFDDCICCLEKVGAKPGQGVVSMFTFGKGVGYIMGVLESHFIPYQEVTPVRWKGEFGCNLGKSFSTKEKKEADITACKKLYPSISLRRTPKCRTDDDGIADALLLATYAKRKF